MFGRLAPRKSGEARQLAQRQVHAERARTAAIRRNAGAEVGGQGGRIEKPFEGELWVQVGDDCARRDPLALVRDDADGAALLDQDLVHGAIRANVDVANGAGARDRLRNRAHAADRMAPDAFFAVHLAPAMVEKHVARAGRIRAVVGSDDSVEAEDRLDRVALEPLVENVAGRAGEKFEEIALPFEVERAQAVSDFGGIDEGAETGGETLSGRDIGRRLERKRAQDVGQALEPRLVDVEPLGVAGGELGDLCFRASRPNLEIAPVGQRQEIGEGSLDDPEPVGVKFEIADDRRVQQRDRVGGDRIAEAGVKFLGDRRAADLRAAFEHRDFEAGHGEIGGGDEAVVTAADDDDVRHQGCGLMRRRAVQRTALIRTRLSRATFSPRERGFLISSTSPPRKGGAALLPRGEGGPKGRMRAAPRYTSNLTPCASGSLAE